jgi:hypothetical protein
MGQLLRGMGPGVFADLLPWLLQTLRSEGSGVERSGAAQGLAEALAVLGEGHLAQVGARVLCVCACMRVRVCVLCVCCVCARASTWECMYKGYD